MGQDRPTGSRRGASEALAEVGLPEAELESTWKIGADAPHAYAAEGSARSLAAPELLAARPEDRARRRAGQRQHSYKKQKTLQLVPSTEIFQHLRWEKID